MTTWFTSPETTPKATCPSEPFVRFASKFPKKADFLELGSGSGNNLHWLEEQGYAACGVDSAPGARADYYMTIDEYFALGSFIAWDCIFDINTLCHVENPPYEAIYKALKPRGKFFSIHPADDTEVDMAGKGYTRLADALTIRRLLLRASWQFSIHRSTNWNGDTKITAWQIEAEK